MLEVARYAGSLVDNLSHQPSGIELYWLGQAGFLVRSPSASFLIDAYLSDRLAEKYRGHIFPHIRQVEPPITVAEIPAIDFVFCTHHHGDHLDIPTIIEVAHKFPGARFVVPARERAGSRPGGLEERTSNLGRSR